MSFAVSNGAVFREEPLRSAADAIELASLATSDDFLPHFARHALIPRPSNTEDASGFRSRAKR
jgi:hypothetical protein